MFLFSSLLVLGSCQVAVATTTAGEAPTAYTASGAFLTSAYGAYWNDPTATSAQPQPVITDRVTNTVFPEILTDPFYFPKNDTVDPRPLPLPSTPSDLLSSAVAQIAAIAVNPAFGGNKCAQCMASLEVAKFLVMAAPEQGPFLAEAVCEHFNYSSTCYDEYSELALGSVFSQVVALSDVGGADGQCGERLKVLHVSDIHIDPRYATGTEANCSKYLYCRENAYNAQSPDQVLLPASRYSVTFSTVMAAETLVDACAIG